MRHVVLRGRPSIRFMLLWLVCAVLFIQPQASSMISDQSNPASTGYPYAYAMPGCAPHDGPAVWLYCTTSKASENEMPKPFLQISIFKDVSELSGKTFSLGSMPNSLGSALRCPGSGNCKPAKNGIVHIQKVNSDKSIEGDYELEFEPGTKMKGTFRASWINKVIPCG